MPTTRHPKPATAADRQRHVGEAADRLGYHAGCVIRSSRHAHQCETVVRSLRRANHLANLPAAEARRAARDLLRQIAPGIALRRFRSADHVLVATIAAKTALDVLIETR